MNPIAMDDLAHLGSALAIGLLIGIERGWRARDVAEGGRTAGIRTYALIGLLGAAAGLLSRTLGGWAFAVLGLPFAAAFILFKQGEQEEQDDHSVTDVVAALLVFALGAWAMLGDERLAGAAAVVVAILLALKNALHGWLKRLTWPELRSALVLLTMSFVILPTIPDRWFGPYGAINPHELWLLTIALAGVSFLAYAAIRIYGRTLGVALGSVAGALLSSTAVTLNLARLNRRGPEAGIVHAAAALLAAAVMAIRLMVIVGFLAPTLLGRLSPPLGAFAAVCAALGLAGVLRFSRTGGANQPSLPMKSPFDLGEVFKFALILGLILAATKIVPALFGGVGLLPVAAVGGLADADAVAIAAARSQAQGQVDPRLAIYAVLLAGAVNSIIKVAIAAVVGGIRFGALLAVGTLLALLAGAAMMVL